MWKVYFAPPYPLHSLLSILHSSSMLACHQQHCLHLHRHPFFNHHQRRRPNSTISLNFSPTSSSTHLHNHDHDPSPQPHKTPVTTTSTDDLTLRTHNSKSSSFLHHYLNAETQHQNTAIHLQNSQDGLTPEEKARILEMSLVSVKRAPKFPGSISLQPAQSPHSPLRTLFMEGSEEEEEEIMMKAVEIRRKVTAEIFKQVMMRKGKFGITYSTNVVSRLGSFIDFVMIAAAAKKRLPEFEFSSFNVRAKAVIEESEVVPLIRWLKHNGLTYPKIANLVCAASGNLEIIRKFADWLKTIHVKGEFIGVVLVKAGEDILKRRFEELDQIVAYLESNGVRMDWMGYVMSRCPQLLTYDIEEVKTRVWFYRDMGMNEKDFGTMVFDYPRVLGHFSLEEMNQKVNYLKEFGLTSEYVGRLVAFKPQLMGCSIEERWKPLVKYLYYFGISRDGMRRMLTIKPAVFCFDLEKTIVPKVRFFQDIGIRDDAIGNMLVKFPPLLTYSLYKKIRRVVVFLMTKAGVSKRNIAKTIALGPELLGCNVVHKLEVNVKYFRSLGIHLRQLGEMIADFPMLLRYNTDLLRPKYRYLRRIMVRPLKDLIEFPRFFSYSLEGRIIPRHKVLVEKRINLKLRYMLACSDEEFEKNVEAALERRRRFESRMMNNALLESPMEDEFPEEMVDHFSDYQKEDEPSEQAVDHFSDSPMEDDDDSEEADEEFADSEIEDDSSDEIDDHFQ